MSGKRWVHEHSSMRCLVAALFFSIVLLAFTDSSAGQELSITGYRLGDSFDQTYAKLSATYKIYPIKIPNDAAQQVFVASTPDRKDQYTIQGADGRVVFIEHEIRFATGSEPNKSETLTNLRSKFGQPSDSLGEAGQAQVNYHWIYDPTGKVIQMIGGYRPQRHCEIDQTGTALPPTQVTGAFQRSFQLQPPNDCFNAAYARWDFDMSHPELLKSLYIAVADRNYLRQHYDSRGAAQKRSRDAEAEKAKQNKAPM